MFTTKNLSRNLAGIIAATLLAGTANAQIDARSGHCEDSTCSRRSPNFSAPTGSVSSVTPGSGGSTSTSCTPGNNPESTNCPAGYSGYMTRDRVTSCPSGSSGAPSYSYTPYDQSQCKINAAPGPAPGPSLPPPEPEGCLANDGLYYPHGTIKQPCDVNNNAEGHPYRQTYSCFYNGWVIANPGDSLIYMYCR